MTAEQIEDLFFQIDHLNPSETEQEKFKDAEYEEETKRLEEENRGVLWEDTMVTSGPAPLPVTDAPGEWEELDEDWFDKH